MKNKKRNLLYITYKGICQNCGIRTSYNDFKYIKKEDIQYKQLGPTFPTVEHIVPRCMGGSSNIDNLTLYCHRCNNIGSLYVLQMRLEINSG